QRLIFFPKISNLLDAHPSPGLPPHAITGTHVAVLCAKGNTVLERRKVWRLVVGVLVAETFLERHSGEGGVELVMLLVERIAEVLDAAVGMEGCPRVEAAGFAAALGDKEDPVKAVMEPAVGFRGDRREFIRICVGVVELRLLRAPMAVEVGVAIADD